MKKILHLGCSWSQFNHEGQKGVPENTVEVLKEKNVDVLYYSASHGGCDLGTQFEVLKSEIGKGYDFIIFQVTSDSRHHIRTGHYNLDWTPTVSHPTIYKCDVSLRKSFVFWNPNYGKAIDQFWHKHNRDYRMAAKLSYSYDWDDQSLYFGQICSIKKILEKSNTPYIIYSHRNIWWEKHNNIFQAHTTDLLDFDVETQLGDNFNSYIVDDGHHLSSQGNRIVAEELIVPRLLPYL